MHRVNSTIRLSLLIVALLVGGCSSDPSEPSDQTLKNPQMPWFLSMAAPSNYGHFYITAQSSGTSTLYNSGGIIYTSTAQTQTTNGGTMTAGSLQITPDSNDVYFAIAQPMFGTTASWGLSGNPVAGIPSFSDSMYVPDEIILVSPSLGSVISKSNALTITWNQDIYNDTVAIWLRYDNAVSAYADSTLPNSAYSKYWIVSDNGQFSIPSSDLLSIPTGGYASIVIARGNSKLTGSSTHKFVVYSASTASGIFKMVQ